MSVLDSLRKGFRFFLMSMGVSTYAKKKPVPKPPAAPSIRPE
jgi:hypothetical protein